jgi:hypothetical protein
MICAVMVSSLIIPAAAENVADRDNLSVIISYFAEQEGYAGEYIKDDVLYIATTDYDKLLALKSDLIKKTPSLAAALEGLMFSDAEYSYAQLEKAQAYLNTVLSYYGIAATDMDFEQNAIIIQSTADLSAFLPEIRQRAGIDNIKAIRLKNIVAGDDVLQPVAPVKPGFKTIDGIKHLVTENGDSEPYTGWTKTASGKRYYYSDGVRLTGVQVMKGFAYVFDGDGRYMSRRDMNGSFVIRLGVNQTVSSDAAKFKPVLICNDETAKPWEYTADSIFKLYYYDGKTWQPIDLPVAFDIDVMRFPEQPPFEALVGRQRLVLDKKYFDFDFRPGLYRMEFDVKHATDSGLDFTVANEFSIR